MIQMPKISIIIPVYNVEEYIEECLLSVMRQTYIGEMECILVDDCGNDNSIGVAQKLISNYKGHVVFRLLHHERNRGLSAARNTGIAFAKGDYIYCLDSDDYISDDCLEVLAAPLQTREYDVVIGDYSVFGDISDVSWLKENRYEIIGNENIFTSYTDWKIYVMAWNKLCRTSFLRENGIDFLEGQLHEDVLWTYKTMLYVNSISIVHKVVYNYRVRVNSIKTDKSKVQQKLLSFSKTIEYIQTHPYGVEPLYLKCLFFYWNLYLSIAFNNRISFFKDYIKLRKTCPYHPVRQLLSGKVSLNQICGVHYALPPLLAYVYLQIRYGKRVK